MHVRLCMLLLCFSANESYLSHRRVRWRSSFRFHSDEEGLHLEASIESCSFLNNIREYGNARMARRAVGILQKMPAYFVAPTIDHFNAAIEACEKSDSYALAVSVYEQMKATGVARNSESYEHLMSCAEKCKKYAEALELLGHCEREDLLTTRVFNTAIWAAERVGNSAYVLDLLARMEELGVARDEMTYLAAANAAEKNGRGEVALHILDLMRQEGLPYATPICQAVLWACVKSGMWEQALALFDGMGAMSITREVECYNGAIWACEMGGLWERAVELLRLMKVDKGFRRQTIAYDGAISALSKAGQWEKARELLKWMDMEKVPKSPVSYRCVLEAMYEADQGLGLMEPVHKLATRDGFFLPWMPGTRMLDVSSMSDALVFCTINSVLNSVRDGKLAPFDMQIVFRNTRTEEGLGFQDLERFFALFDPSRKLRLIEVDGEDGLLRAQIAKDSIAQWAAHKSEFKAGVAVARELGDDAAPQESEAKDQAGARDTPGADASLEQRREWARRRRG